MNARDRFIRHLSVSFLCAVLGISLTAGAPEVLDVSPGAAGTQAETRVSVTGAGFTPFADVSLLPGGLFQAAFRPTPFVAERIALHEDYALVTDRNRCITVFDISDPFDPAEVGLANPSGGCFDVVVESGYAYATSNSIQGIYAIDLDDPTDPQVVREVETGIRDGVLAVQGDLLFVGGSRDGGGGKLQVYSLASPDNPSLLATRTYGSHIDLLELRGDLLYVVFARNLLIRDNFKIFDVTVPADPQELGSLEVDTSWGLHVEGDLAYVARRTDGLVIVDVSDAGSPSLVVEFDPPSPSFNALDVKVVGTTAYVSGGPGLTLLDVEDPANPAPIADIQVQFGGRALEIVGDNAFLVAGGLVVVNFGNTATPEFYLTEIPTVPDSTFNILILNDYAYVSALNHGLLTIDVRDPLDPSVVSINDEPRRPRDVVEDGGRLFTSGRELSIFNLRPSDPKRIGVTDSSVGLGVAVAGDLAFTVNNNLGLTVYDISKRSEPRRVSSRAGLGVALDVAAKDNLVFVAGGFAGLFVIDVSVPRFPAIVGNYDTAGSAVAVAIAGAHVLVADDRGDLLTFDVSSPTRPVPVNVYEGRGDADNVIVRGTTAYLSDSEDGFVELDVLDPTHPVPKGIYGGKCRGFRVDVTDTHLFRIGPELRVCRLNPPLPDVHVLSPTEIELTVPSDFAPGAYHVRVTDRQTGEHAILYNGLAIDPGVLPGSGVGTTDP